MFDGSSLTRRRSTPGTTGRCRGLLDALILQRKQEAVDYKAYLAKIVELARKVRSPETGTSYPSSINSGALRSFFDNLQGAAVSIERPLMRYSTEPAVDVLEAKALALDHAIRDVKKADWRGNKFKEREVRNAIRSELGDDEGLVDAIFEIVKAQSDY